MDAVVERATGLLSNRSLIPMLLVVFGLSIASIYSGHALETLFTTGILFIVFYKSYLWLAFRQYIWHTILCKDRTVAYIVKQNNANASVQQEYRKRVPNEKRDTKIHLIQGFRKRHGPFWGNAIVNAKSNLSYINRSYDPSYSHTAQWWWRDPFARNVYHLPSKDTTEGYRQNYQRSTFSTPSTKCVKTSQPQQMQEDAEASPPIYYDFPWLKQAAVAGFGGSRYGTNYRFAPPSRYYSHEQALESLASRRHLKRRLGLEPTWHFLENRIKRSKKLDRSVGRCNWNTIGAMPYVRLDSPSRRRLSESNTCMMTLVPPCLMKAYRWKPSQCLAQMAMPKSKGQPFEQLAEKKRKRTNRDEADICVSKNKRSKSDLRIWNELPDSQETDLQNSSHYTAPVGSFTKSTSMQKRNAKSQSLPAQWSVTSAQPKLTKPTYRMLMETNKTVTAPFTHGNAIPSTLTSPVCPSSVTSSARSYVVTSAPTIVSDLSPPSFTATLVSSVTSGVGFSGKLSLTSNDIAAELKPLPRITQSNIEAISLSTVGSDKPPPPAEPVYTDFLSGISSAAADSSPFKPPSSVSAVIGSSMSLNLSFDSPDNIHASAPNTFASAVNSSRFKLTDSADTDAISSHALYPSFKSPENMQLPSAKSVEFAAVCRPFTSPTSSVNSCAIHVFSSPLQLSLDQSKQLKETAATNLVKPTMTTSPTSTLAKIDEKPRVSPASTSTQPKNIADTAERENASPVRPKAISNTTERADVTPVRPKTISDTIAKADETPVRPKTISATAVIVDVKELRPKKISETVAKTDVTQVQPKTISDNVARADVTPVRPKPISDTVARADVTPVRPKKISDTVARSDELTDVRADVTLGRPKKISDTAAKADAIPVPPAAPKYERLPDGNYAFIVFDLETTGFGAADIVQLAATCGDRTFNEYVLPNKNIAKGASDVTGITKENGNLYKDGEEVPFSLIGHCLQQFEHWMHGYDNPVLVAHNCFAFDSYVLTRQILKWWPSLESKITGFVDTLPLFKEVFPGKGSYKQEKLLEEEGISYDAHCALADVRALDTLIQRKNVNKALMLKHSRTMEGVLQYTKIREAKHTAKNSMYRLTDNKVLSESMANKIADCGLNYHHLKSAYQSDRKNGIRSILSDEVDGRPRVTKTERIIKAVGDYFASLELQ